MRDIDAARAAGMRSIAVDWGYLGEDGPIELVGGRTRSLRRSMRRMNAKPTRDAGRCAGRPVAVDAVPTGGWGQTSAPVVDQAGALVLDRAATSQPAWEADDAPGLDRRAAAAAGRSITLRQRSIAGGRCALIAIGTDQYATVEAAEDRHAARAPPICCKLL